VNLVDFGVDRRVVESSVSRVVPEILKQKGEVKLGDDDEPGAQREGLNGENANGRIGRMRENAEKQTMDQSLPICT
jgi:hypothetical protein